MTTWFGVLAPEGHAAAIVGWLNANMQKMLDEPATKKRLVNAGIEPGGGSAEAFAAQIRSDYRKWEGIVKASGAKLDE